MESEVTVNTDNVLSGLGRYEDIKVLSLKLCPLAYGWSGLANHGFHSGSNSGIRFASLGSVDESGSDPVMVHGRYYNVSKRRSTFGYCQSSVEDLPMVDTLLSSKTDR